MILQFWLATILLLVIVSVFSYVPFIKRKQDEKRQDNTRNQLNRSLYDIRLSELERDAEQGVLSDKDKMLTELQYNLLDDIDDNEEVKHQGAPKWIFLPGLLLLVAGSLALYSSVGSYQKVVHWQDTVQRYPALQQQLFKNPNAQPTEQDLRDIMLGLRTNLYSNSNDAQGWLLYSRLGMVFKNSELALSAIKKAYQLAPESVDIRLLYIQLKMQSGDEYLQQQAQFMLTKLLSDQPNNMDAWSMSAFMALEKEDYTAAIFSWKRMLTMILPNTEQARILNDSIDYAQNRLAEGKVQLPVKRTNIDKTALKKGHYRVEISLAKEVVIPKKGTLFVYAQATNGSLMPIAAIKMAMPRFPVSIDISDDNSMVEGLKLSSHNEFTISARLSIDANVNNKKGQWQGRSVVIEKDQRTPILIKIDSAL
ncbi:cytochrome c-type biogenesis protein CcmI [Psychromonas sp. CNPT3]|uniref:c-type cytochrome biogenesis protein CcmI n=1 Tax=Psychromonas sp. CNPT3 TaxID=314282 RepID=UPI00006E78AE|nr:c-type cytochrome biogenesis protein CcmI [Psychromonas sp. CNPT3]AGH82022.1 cytochrome c-type biogenesis protein CcmI [Psychromonas sp. CNPT3]